MTKASDIAGVETVEVDHLRDRVRIYFLVMLCVDLGGYVSDTVTPLFIEDLEHPERPLDNPDVEQDITHGNAIVGTPHYLTPEAISTPDAVGPSADVYALGAMAFFLLTGREVFPGRSLIEVCSQHLNATPSRPSDVLGGAVDADLEALILRCLAKDPDDRPGDGAALSAVRASLDLPGWSADDARTWWSALPGRLEGAADGLSVMPTPTRLEVEVQGRR